MPGVTLKVSARMRDRLRGVACRVKRPMGAVMEEALDCYERSLLEAEYRDGWQQFMRDKPAAFEEYMRESRDLDTGFNEPVRE